MKLYRKGALTDSALAEKTHFPPENLPARPQLRAPPPKSGGRVCITDAAPSLGSPALRASAVTPWGAVPPSGPETLA